MSCKGRNIKGTHASVKRKNWGVMRMRRLVYIVHDGAHRPCVCTFLVNFQQFSDKDTVHITCPPGGIVNMVITDPINFNLSCEIWWLWWNFHHTQHRVHERVFEIKNYRKSIMKTTNFIGKFHTLKSMIKLKLLLLYHSLTLILFDLHCTF